MSMELKPFGHSPKEDSQSSMGVQARLFMLHLKEGEFRFMHRNENLYQIIKKLLNSRACLRLFWSYIFVSCVPEVVFALFR